MAHTALVPTSTSMRPSGRCRGGPGLDGAVAGVEEPFVAGAVQLGGVGFVVDDAAQMGALLGEGSKLATGEVDEDGGVGVGGVAEQVRGALGNPVEVDDAAGLAGVDRAQRGPQCDADGAAAKPPDPTTR